MEQKYSKKFSCFSDKKKDKKRSPVLADMMMRLYIASVIRHVFIIQNAEKEDAWAFLNVLGGQIIFL